MLKKIIRYVKGYLHIEICGYSPERFLNLCRNKQISIWGLIPRDNCYQMSISIKGFRKLKPILRKTKTKVHVKEKIGLPFLLYRYRDRKAFAGGFFLCIAIIYVLSLFLWDIQIDGNLRITDETILEYLQGRGVKYGIWKNSIDCDRIVKDIRKKYDDIVWVSVSTKGSFLRIHVKENTDSVKEVQEDVTPSDLFAKKSGKIIDIITRSGIPKVKIGETVKKGQLLVSGQVEILNDSGEVTDIQLQHSDADIIAETKYKYYEELPLKYMKKQYTGKKRRSFGVKQNISKKFTFQDTFISYKQWKIGRNFYLPIYTSERIIYEYKKVPAVYSKEEVQQLLSLQFEQYLNDLKEEGKLIQSYNIKIYIEKEKAYAKGNIILWEDIGKQAVINIDF